jgi:alkylation response protein AidB-like acyl-CoA dehydrogenase
MSAASPWRLTPEERDFADSVAGVAEQARPAADALERGEAGAAALLARLAPLELAGAAVPEALGGAGARPRTALVAIDRLARVSPAAAMLVAHDQAAAWALADSGEDFASFGAMLRGSEHVAVATAPVTALSGDRGSRIPRVAATADGARWAGTLLLLAGGWREGAARTLLVRTPSPDCNRRPRPRTGLRGLGTDVLELDLALDDDASVLPAAVADRALAWVAVATAVAATAVAATAHAEATAYVAERRQFGGPLADLPLVREMLDEARERLAQAEARVAQLVEADPARAAAEEGAVRAVARTAVEVCDTALQLHGGYGYVDELPLERRLRDSLTLRALAAATEWPPEAQLA